MLFLVNQLFKIYFKVCFRVGTFTALQVFLSAASVGPWHLAVSVESVECLLGAGTVTKALCV